MYRSSPAKTETIEVKIEAIERSLRRLNNNIESIITTQNPENLNEMIKSLNKILQDFKGIQEMLSSMQDTQPAKGSTAVDPAFTKSEFETRLKTIDETIKKLKTEAYPARAQVIAKNLKGRMQQASIHPSSEASKGTSTAQDQALRKLQEDQKNILDDIKLTIDKLTEYKNCRPGIFAYLIFKSSNREQRLKIVNESVTALIELRTQVEKKLEGTYNELDHTLDKHKTTFDNIYKNMKKNLEEKAMLATKGGLLNRTIREIDKRLSDYKNSITANIPRGNRRSSKGH